MGPSVGDELLPESQVLQNQGAARNQGGPEDPDKEGEEKAHGIAILAQRVMA